MAIVLSITLFIYITKLKFTYEFENQIPWDRSLTKMNNSQIQELYNNTAIPNLNCDMVHPYCVSDEDCHNMCHTSDFRCIQHKCLKQRSNITQTTNCDAKKGGVDVIDIAGESVCLCTQPMFYIGDKCSVLNPTLRNHATIAEDWDARLHTPSLEFIKCKEPDYKPIKLRNFFACVHPNIYRTLSNLYPTDNR